MSDNIIFMGTSKFAVPILEKISESNLNISVVYTQPPKKSSRGMKIQKTPIHVKSELLGLPIRTPNSLKNNIDEYNFIKKNKTHNCCSDFIWSNYTKGIFGPFQKWFFKYSCIHLAQI